MRHVSLALIRRYSRTQGADCCTSHAERGISREGLTQGTMLSVCYIPPVLRHPPMCRSRLHNTRQGADAAAACGGGRQPQHTTAPHRVVRGRLEQQRDDLQRDQLVRNLLARARTADARSRRGIVRKLQSNVEEARPC
eukprot:2753015-Pleurochrysis_carterae.AAC.1